MGRPTSSTRLRREDCDALPVSKVPGLPPRGRPENTARWKITVVAGDKRSALTLQLTRTARGWRFLCPGCGRNAMNLYFPPDSPEPRCRVCLDLVYASQYDYMPLGAVYLRGIFEEMNRQLAMDEMLRRPSA